jgi:non-heme chloroperoxidase
MGFVATKDGVEIFYKDWGPSNAQPIMFHHGWPLSSDDWDTQMLFFLSKGYRVIAHERRGHGRSSQVGEGHDINHYAADASAVAQRMMGSAKAHYEGIKAFSETEDRRSQIDHQRPDARPPR